MARADGPAACEDAPGLHCLHSCENCAVGTVESRAGNVRTHVVRVAVLSLIRHALRPDTLLFSPCLMIGPCSKSEKSVIPNSAWRRMDAVCCSLNFDLFKASSPIGHR